MRENKDANLHPVVRALGVVLLGCAAFASYFAAIEGNILAMVFSLGWFVFFAPPIVVGRLPRPLRLIMKGEFKDLNSNPFKCYEGEDRVGFWVALIAAFCVAVISTMSLTSV